MFGCPSCNATSISLKSKVRSSIFSPILCSACDAKFVISRSAMVKAALLSLIVFALCTAIIVLIAGTVLAALGALLYGLIVFVAAAVISGMTYYLYWLAPLRRV
jgi:hypothetical protein